MPPKAKKAAVPTEDVEMPDSPNGQCKVCHQPIMIAIFKGGLWCSENHRKVYMGEKKAGLR